MKRNNKITTGDKNRGYQVFKEYPVKIKRKKVELEQHYVVPWEITDTGNKK